MPPVNPYSAGGMVQDPAMFFGRDEELGRIRDRLRKGDSTAVVGLRRIGKSSLLYQLAHQADALPEGVVAVYLDLQDAAHHRPLDLLASALRSLNERLNGRYDLPPIKSLGDFSVAIKQVVTDGFRPALCLDEVEELTDHDAFDDDFFEALRSLGNQRLLAFVTASGEFLDVLLKRKKRTSPFYNLFINLDLAGLSDKATVALLTEPFRSAGLSPSPPDHLAYALELTGHHPFYLQVAAHHLFEAQKGSERVLNRLALCDAFTRDAEPHFRGLWRHLSADEQAGVRKLAGMPAAVQDWEHTCADLLRFGLAEGDAASPRLFSTVFAEMVKTGEIERRPSPRLHTIQPSDDDRPSAIGPARLSVLNAAISVIVLIAIGAIIGAMLSKSVFLFGVAVIASLITIVLTLVVRARGIER